ncbi:MAG: hypothetical protein Ct9H300mP15_15030 [Gemmatimonadota bacterium]|nr:MAG: hypothetical protein Ct9H300mP15_15030 [Gemmatimonadota bacterium]
MIVTGVGFLIHVFSVGYMRPMLGTLVTSLPEFIHLLHARTRHGCELPTYVCRVGRCGALLYLLIGFWFRIVRNRMRVKKRLCQPNRGFWFSHCKVSAIRNVRTLDSSVILTGR